MTKNSTKCWIFNNVYVDGNFKVRDHYHIAGKYKGSPCRDYNVKVNLHQKIPIVFPNLKKYDSHLVIAYKANSVLK